METKKLLYIFDPLCCWSYGFSKTAQQILHEFHHKADNEIICGGMATGGRTDMIGEVYNYLHQTMKEVEQKSELKFGNGFKVLLEEGCYLYNSFTPGVAINAFKKIDKYHTIDFVKDVQEAFFYYGKSLNNINTYLDIIEKYNIDKGQFTGFYKDEEIMRNTISDFNKTNTLKISWFPTMALEQSNNTEFIVEGYKDYRTVKESLDHYFKKSLNSSD